MNTLNKFIEDKVSAEIDELFEKRLEKLFNGLDKNFDGKVLDRFEEILKEKTILLDKLYFRFKEMMNILFTQMRCLLNKRIHDHTDILVNMSEMHEHLKQMESIWIKIIREEDRDKLE